MGAHAGSALVAVLLALASLVVVPGAGAAIESCSGTGSAFAGGSGTSAAPYLVATADQLAAIRSSTYRACAFRQTADVALSGEWTPIGTGALGSYFTGEYDGGGHLISGLSITTGTNDLGLFGYTGEGAVLQNIRLAGSVRVADGFRVGALVGLADRPTTIRNVHSSVSVSGRSSVGGLVGWLMESTIDRSSSTGAVTAVNDYVGGLVGYARSSYDDLPASITDSYAQGAVTGGDGYEGVGGLLGRAESNPSPYQVAIVRSYAAGRVTGGTGSRVECVDDEAVGPDSCTTLYGTTGGIVAPLAAGLPTERLFVTGGFWDTQTTGRATTADDKGTGATTVQMMVRSTFASAGWDISSGWSATAVWGICEGSTYPFLNAQHGSSPCVTPPARASTAPRAPTAKPRTRITVSTPVDGSSRAVIRWSADADTVPTTLTTTLPPGVEFARTRAGCATVRGRVVSVAVPALRAGERGSCSFALVVTTPTVSLTLQGGATRVVSRTVRATASSPAWVRSALAILDRGAARATLNHTLDAVQGGRLSHAGAAAVVRSQVLAVREAQVAALGGMDRAPASLVRAERLLRRSLVLSAKADRAYLAWLEGEPEALGRAITLGTLAAEAKARLIPALQGHGVAVPPATALWP